MGAPRARRGEHRGEARESRDNCGDDHASLNFRVRRSSGASERYVTNVPNSVNNRINVPKKCFCARRTSWGEEADGSLILGFGGIARHQIDLPWLGTSSRCARPDMRSAALPIAWKEKEWPKDIGSRSITLYLIPRRSPRTRSSLGRPSPPTAAGPSLEAFLPRLTRKG